MGVPRKEHLALIQSWVALSPEVVIREPVLMWLYSQKLSLCTHESDKRNDIASFSILVDPAVTHQDGPDSIQAIVQNNILVEVPWLATIVSKTATGS